MSGISIPISGDLGPLQEAFALLAKDMRALANTISRSFAPAADGARKVSVETRKMTRSAKEGRKGFLELAQGVSAVGANVAHIAVGVRSFRNMKTGAVQAAASIRRMASSPALRKVALAAAGATVAIVGTVAVVKTLRGGLRMLAATGRTVFRTIGGLGKAAFRGIQAAAGGMTRLLTGGSMLGGIARLAGVAGLLAVATTQLKGAFSAATGFEDMQVRMEQFVGDAGKAKALIDEMTDFSTRTPFETKDVLGAGSKLLSAGIGGDIGQLTRDIASVAKDGQQLGELADAVAKGFAKGKFQTEELNKFLERGINLMPELAAVTGLAGDELKKAIEAGLSFDQVGAAISRMSREGGQFFGLLERQSRTTTGLISTLKSAWDEVRRAFAQPLMDGIKPILTTAIERLNELRTKAAEVGKAVRDIFMGAFVLIRDGRAMELLEVGFKLAVEGAVELLMRGLRSSVAFLAAALPPIFEMAFGKMKDPVFWKGISTIVKGLGLEISAAINSGLGKKNVAQWQQGAAGGFLTQGGRMLTRSGEGHDIGAVLASALSAGQAAAKTAGMGPVSDKLQKALGEWNSLMSSVAVGVAALKEKTRIPGVTPGATGESAGQRIDPVTGEPTLGAGAQSMFFGSALSRVGGGGFGGLLTPMVSLQQKTNQLLSSIDRNTRDGAGSEWKFSPA